MLTEILRLGGATPGTTLVAYVDEATLEVVAVRSLPTPDAILDAENCHPDQTVHALSDVLCSIALECAPKRFWAGDRWSAMTGDLITVVCRDGRAEITPTETLFHWGWRYSNHLTSAFQGEVYAVTPQGWVSLYHELSGPEPSLTCQLDPAVAEAEHVLTELSSALLGPAAGECLLCYVYRMIGEHGCDCRLRFATHYRDVRAPRATGLERRLGQVGGFCDCEIFLNGYEPRQALWVPDGIDDPNSHDVPELTWPQAMPACGGVRAGSTQPCSLWCRQGRSW